MRYTSSIEKGFETTTPLNAMNKTGQHKKAMIEALERSLGVVTTACKSVGIGRTTHYSWMESDEDYRNAVNDISGVALDFAESQLHKQIKEGNTSATIFFLKTQGKKRGYIERQEHEHIGDLSVTINEVKKYSGDDSSD